MATVVPAVRSLEEEIRSNPSPRNSNASPRASTTTPLLLGHPLSPSAPATTPPRQPLSGAPSTPSEGVPFQIPHPLWPAPNPMTPASAATTPSHAYNHNNNRTPSDAASMYAQTPMDAASELLDLADSSPLRPSPNSSHPHLFDPAKAYHDKFGGIQAPTGRQLPKSLAAEAALVAAQKQSPSSTQLQQLQRPALTQEEFARQQRPPPPSQAALLEAHLQQQRHERVQRQMQGQGAAAVKLQAAHRGKVGRRKVSNARAAEQAERRAAARRLKEESRMASARAEEQRLMNARALASEQQLRMANLRRGGGGGGGVLLTTSWVYRGCLRLRLSRHS